MSKRRPSGDGMVRRKEDGRWEGRIVIGHKENGDSIFRYIYAPTQKELTAKLRQEITAYQGVDLTEDSKLTLSEWLDYWLDAIMAGTIRPSTLNGYRRYADLYIKPYLLFLCLRFFVYLDIAYSDLQNMSMNQIRQNMH